MTPLPARGATLGRKFRVAIASNGVYETGMEDVVNYLVPIAVGVVAVILVLGLINMMRGGSTNTSQRLMRWRVAAQFVAIIVIMAAIWIAGR